MVSRSRSLGSLPISILGLSVLAAAAFAFAGCGSEEGEVGAIDLAPSAADDREGESPRPESGGANGEPGSAVNAAGDQADAGAPPADGGAKTAPTPSGYAVGATVRTTDDLNLRAGAGTQHAVVVTMPKGAVITVVNATPNNGFYNVKYASLTGWASATYLTAAPGATADQFPKRNITTPVPVRAHVQLFANMSCAIVGCPDVVSSYNGHSPSVDRALDVFQLRERGDRYAEFGVADKIHRVDYVIWRQRINTRDGRGWRMMEDRGSITQNHYDHVHVSFDP